MKIDFPVLGLVVMFCCTAAFAQGSFVFTSLPYEGDAANNVAVDSKTSLQWRRCSEGQAWSGSTCTGTAAVYTHEQALAQANSRPGWRLPTLKELSSLVDKKRVNPSIDPVAFPATPSSYYWSASPFANGSSDAWGVLFYDGYVSSYSHGNTDAVRLVRTHQ